MTPALSRLQQLQTSLDELRSHPSQTSAWAARARHCPELLDALPPRFSEVWLGLLDRLESSALFAEESCSFSQIDLLDSLAMWLDKARARLQA